MERKRYSLIESFSFAFRGLGRMVKNERNFKIELLCAFLITLMGIILQFSLFEWLVILLLIGLVLSAEIFNSAVENVCNLLKEKLNLEYHETKLVRDTAAAAPLLISIFAALIGLIIILKNLF